MKMRGRKVNWCDQLMLVLPGKLGVDIPSYTMAEIVKFDFYGRREIYL
jgi:hypothetical protein